MADDTDDERVFALWAAAAAPGAVEPSARARLLAALDAERYLPFCAELARHFDLAEQAMRTLLARIVDPAAWTPGTPPVESFVDFEPGAAVHPLRAGFVRLAPGAKLSAHRHTDRELTFVLEGELVDGEGQRHGPGTAIAMPAASAHELGAPPESGAVVALLHGRIELLREPVTP
jgi:ChrR Cupin-like domain